MPPFLIKRIASFNAVEETIETATARITEEMNRNFSVLNRLLLGEADWINVSPAGMLQTWQDSSTDNIVNTHPMSVFVYFPAETARIHKGLLRLRLMLFRAYSTSAASDPGQTSGPSSTVTTADGGANIITSSAGGSTQPTSGGGQWFTDSGYTSGMRATDMHGSHDHGGAVSNDGSHGHVITLNHRHTVTIPAHTHTVTIPYHNHNMEHTHWIAPHTHDIIHGVYEAPVPTNPSVTVWINGVERTTELGGPFNRSQPELDITEWLTIGGWNEIQLGCAVDVLIRIQAVIFIQAFIRPIGRLDPLE